MTSILSVGQSISNIGKSMAAIARVEEHLATFMKKVIYFERFFQRMGPNLPVCVTDTATLLFQRCYEYRDEICDELESSVAYVADAGRWVVGIGDWNSKMETRLSQVSELVLLANTLLAEYAVRGKVGADGCRDELVAYLQTLAATVTLKNALVNRKDGRMVANSNNRSPTAQTELTKTATLSSQTSALGMAISGVLSGMLGNNNCNSSESFGTNEQISIPRSFDTDDEAMNPFADSYRRAIDPNAKGVNSAGDSVTCSVQSLSDTTVAGADGKPGYALTDRETLEDPLNCMSMGEYECLEIDSIPKYAAFRSSAKLAARRQNVPGSGHGSLTVGASSDKETRSANIKSNTKYNDILPSPLVPGQTENFKTLETHASLKTKLPVTPILDMNYAYDFQSEIAHNPFLLPDTTAPCDGDSSSRLKLPSSKQQQAQLVNGTSQAPSSPSTSTPIPSTAIDQPYTSLSLSAGIVDFLSAESDGDVDHLPHTFHKAIASTQVQAQTSLITGSIASAHFSSVNGVQEPRTSTVDTREPEVAATRAKTTEYEHHESDDDLFGVSTI